MNRHSRMPPIPPVSGHSDYVTSTSQLPAQIGVSFQPLTRNSFLMLDVADIDAIEVLARTNKRSVQEVTDIYANEFARLKANARHTELSSVVGQ